MSLPITAVLHNLDFKHLNLKLLPPISLPYSFKTSKSNNLLTPVRTCNDSYHSFIVSYPLMSLFLSLLSLNFFVYHYITSFTYSLFSLVPYEIFLSIIISLSLHTASFPLSHLSCMHVKPPNLKCSSLTTPLLHSHN